jgi:hypothetical protein
MVLEDTGQPVELFPIRVLDSPAHQLGKVPENLHHPSPFFASSRFGPL